MYKGDSEPALPFESSESGGGSGVSHKHSVKSVLAEA